MTDIKPECPGPDCMMCNGEACNYCGAGCWNNNPPTGPCRHDVLVRHQDPPREPTVVQDDCVLLDVAFKPDVTIWSEVASQGRLAAVDRNPAAVYLARLAEGSRGTMRAALERVVAIAQDGATLESFPWHELRYQHTQAIRAQLADRYAPATANRDLSALRGVLRECRRLGLMSAEDQAKASDIERVKGSRVAAGRSLDRQEVERLFGACDPATERGARDAALLAVLYGGGLRRDEAAHLSMADVDPTSGALLVRGKGNKERTVPLGGGARRALEAWLAVRGRGDGPLFLPLTSSGRHVKRDPGGPSATPHLSGDAVYGALQQIRKRAGVAKFSPHDCRRSFVGDLLDAGADLAVVQKLAGHSDPATTSRYDRRGERAKQSAADLLQIPR